MDYPYFSPSRPKNKKAIFSIAIFVAVIVFVAGGIFFRQRNENNKKNVANAQAQVVPAPAPKQPEQFEPIQRPKPAPVSMDRLKTQGCVADGLLSEYNPDWQKYAALINRSSCYYLHRAVETWLKPPDFETIDFEMSQITKKDVVYGMFIAEAINENAVYHDDYTNKDFDFKAMCRPGSDGAWGMRTCKADFSSQEYRNYISYITHRAIDLGVQSFTFGQIFMQEGADGNYAPRIVADIRNYAKKQGVSVVIGAQTNGITDPDYLKLFDYIEGGVGIDQSGNVENGPCLSTRGGCWALLWNNQFSAKANNVLLDLDWTGIKSDDLDIFARMDQNTRAATLSNLYQKFKAQNMGFMLPMFGVLDKDNGGCRGPKKGFYSADNSYTCKDEQAINDILSGKNPTAAPAGQSGASSPSLLQKIENYFSH